MKSQKRIVMMTVVLLGSAAVSANGAVSGGINWADGVEAYSSNIQNYGGSLMSADAEFWLTGAPDADADGNGYMWDAGDKDYVAGWRSNAPNEFIVMRWDGGISDMPGDDLTISLYAGPNASANVLASTDGLIFTQIGTLGGSTPGYLREEAFDFAGLFSEDVKYVRVARVGNGPNSAMFFDAFGGAVPEPTTLSLLGLGGMAVIRRKRRAV